MSVRKRTWITAKGEPREVITYTDRNGDRCQETFAQKKVADARYVEVKAGLKAGTHSAIKERDSGGSWRELAQGCRCQWARAINHQELSRGIGLSHHAFHRPFKTIRGFPPTGAPVRDYVARARQVGSDGA
jgi:hypothetical protein